MLGSCAKMISAGLRLISSSANCQGTRWVHQEVRSIPKDIPKPAQLLNRVAESAWMHHPSISRSRLRFCSIVAYDTITEHLSLYPVDGSCSTRITKRNFTALKSQRYLAGNLSCVHRSEARMALQSGPGCHLLLTRGSQCPAPFNIIIG